MIKRFYILLLAIVASVGVSWATDPIVIATNTEQSSYTQGSITVSVNYVGDSDGFRLNNDNSASISNSGSSTISKIELVPGWFLNKHSYVRANGAEPNSSSEELITFLNVNSNEVTLSCSVSICIKEVRVYFGEAGGGSTDVIPCTPADLGKVLCTDGSIYATVNEATAASKTAAAVIAYVDTENGKALALALADDGGEMEWGPAKTTAAAHTPAVSGGTWTLASKDDWNNMITAAGGYEALRDGFSAVGGTNMQQDAYWSSTPVDDLAWVFYFAYGGKWVDDHVDNPSHVRACLAFDIPAIPTNKLYMEVSGTAGTLKWGLAGSNPVYDGNVIQYDNRKDITTLTIDESCQNHTLTSFYNLFYVFKGLTTINGIENLATANVENMSYMFYDCQSLTSLDLTAFNTANVTNMKGMFNGCSNLTTIYVGDDWNTSAVTNGGAMFYGCTNLPNYDSEATGVEKAYVGAGGYLSAKLTPADVMALISAIGEVEYTAESKAKIDAARTAYNALSAADQALVTNYSTLTAAEKAYADAKQAADQAAAAPVIALINQLPNPMTAADVKLSVYQKVQGARAAYDALTAEQKALVEAATLKRLTDAEAAFAPYVGGMPAEALSGKFTINAGGDQIAFSQGNLQATTADLGANWTWSFAANQWDFIGNAVANTAISDIKSVSTNGTVDLFGWSTAATYYGISNNPGGAYYTGDFIDWGTNAISNGGNTANAWHTLAHDEWYYLFNTRTTTSGIRYAKATVNGIPGIILLPDDWSATYYALSNTNDYDVDFNSNVITTSDWTNSLEANGAVFLPAAGERLGADVNEVGSKGHYWSSTFKTDYNAYCLSFNSYNVDASDYINRREGYSVRLVVAAPVNYIAEAQAALALINAIPTPVTFVEICGNAIKAARAAVTALGEAASLIDDADIQKLTNAEAAWTALIPDPVVLPTVKYAVCNVPDGWAVTANGDAVLPINGRYHIADGQTVVLTPPASKDAESITSAEEAGLIGSGTAEDPYLIYTVANWNAVAAKVNDGTQAAPNCRQMANLNGVTTVMGNSESKPFKGIYDGNGFVFTNINLSLTSGENPLALFGCVNDPAAVVKNVVVAGGTVSSVDRNVGAIVGQLNGGTVQYCANYATISSSYDGSARIGGIVGWMRSVGGDNNRIDHCINYGNVSGVGYVGGIAGSCGAGYVSYCQNYGSLSCSGTADKQKGSAGGIIGWHNQEDATKISYNHNGGNIIEAAASTYGGGRYFIANGDPFNTPASNSYLSSLTLTIGSTSYTGAELATHEPNAQALAINPEGITISGITYAYGVAAPVAPTPGTNPGTDPAKQPNRSWQFTMPSHNIGLAVTIIPKLPGAFSINANGDKVQFAKGNLQATTTDLGANWTWDFAANQWSLIGDAVANNAINGAKTVSANGTVDLFGWSTAATYYGIHNSWKNDDYTGDFVDWGALMGTEWHTLSKEEWNYIVYTRTEAYKKRGQATVNGVPGYVILPDEWELPSSLSFTPNAGNYTANTYDGADWIAMENAGAVFLPAAGVREGSDIYQVNLYGWYWASTPNETDGGKAYYLYFDKSSQGVTEYNRWKSKSVRLVTVAPKTPADVMALINAIGTVDSTPETKAKIDAAREAYETLSDADKAQVTNYETLTNAETAYNNLFAQDVIDKINAIPQPVTLKLATRDSIESARAAYDALTADQKLLVSNYDVLEAAEATMAGLNPGGGAPLPEGALTGAFSINAGGDKIAFSKGNLQATTANLGETWTWAFAAHQYDYVGNAVANTAITGSGTVSANGTVDLFGWSTAATYYGINNTNVSGKHPGDFIDWGETIAEGWRTLTRDEWNYLFETRTDAASKYGHATVAGIHGIIVLPDSYKGTAINADHSDWSNNIISAEDWAAYEANGVAFLPAAGSRLATSVNYVGEYAFYWTSTTYYEKFAYRVGFVPELRPDYGDRVPGQSVRLVTAHTGSPTPLDSAQAVKDLIEAIPMPVTLEDACVNAIQAARDAYNKLSDAAKGALDEATVNKLNQAITDYTALIQAGADAVTAKINNIPQPVTLKLATRDSIESARAAYDALTADQKLLVSNYDVLTAAEEALAALNPGGGMPADALNGKFTINAGGDQIAFAKGNLQATTEDLGAHWTWGFAANQWNYLSIVVANSKINGNGTVSENGTVDLFGWSTAATYYGINNSYKAADYSGDFVDWGPKMGAGWRTLTKDEWNYLIENNTKGRATVNDKNGYIFLPNDWSGPAFTPDPDNFTTNVYSGDDWTAMENAGAVFLPSGPARNGTSALIANDAKYSSSTSLNNDTSYVFTIYYDQSQSACTGTNRAYGCMVRLVTEGGGATPLDSAQAVKDLIEAIPMPVTLEDACVNAIQAARDAYNKLSDAAKGALDEATVNKLNQAITDYTALIQAGADAVIAKINNIPQPVTLKLATGDSIESARAAYDALTADQKLLVTNYGVLTAAEATWAGLINAAPAGALSGKYTINAGGDVIYFAHGNLQYTRESLDADWSTGTFRLATNQYDLIEAEKTYPAAYCTDNYGDKTAVGLFGWGTWGEGKTPNLTSSDRTLYTWSTDFSGTLEGTNTWRTLSKDEWVYLLAHNNQSYATVHGVNGLLVAPDGKDIDGKSMADWVVINDETWTTMQNDGYLFLPACGQRSQMSATANITTGDQGEEVLYYSSTQYSDAAAHNIWYKPGQDPAAADYSNKRQAFGVRLVSAGVNPLDQAQAVKDLIDAIPAEITLDAACVNAIQAARAGYDALDTDAKAILDAADVKKLTDAEQALKDLNQAEADKVVAKINNIPQPVELKLATRDSIEGARAAYDALTAEQKALVPADVLKKLTDAEAALAEKNKGGSTPVDIVWDGNTGIANVDPNTTSPAYEGMTVTVGNGSSFSTYQNRLYFTFYSQPNGGYIFANENGTNITKVVIESTTALTSTMTEVDRMGSGWVISNENKTATWTGNTDSVSIWKGQSFTNYWTVDKITFTVNATSTPLDSAQAVKDLIDAIPTPVEYPTSGPAIAAALVAYNQLSDAAKGALDDADVQKMTDAAAQYAALDAIAAIEAIPAEIVYDPLVKAAIETAREKYDALIDASKALVPEDKVHKLTNAEQAWAILVAKIEHNVSYIGKDGELKHETVALLHIPDPAPDFNGFEFDQWIVKAGDFLEEGLRIQASYTPIITTKPAAFDTLVYNGTAQTLIEAGVAKEGHIEYRLNDGEWSTELPKADMAAAYAVYYKLVREAHDDYMADPIHVTIAKAPVAYTAPAAYDTLVYNAANQTLIAAGQTNDGTFEYSLDPTLLDSWKTELPQAMSAGTHNVYYRVQGDLNHLDSVAATPVAVTIAKAELTATADDKNVIYGDAVPAYSVTYAGWQGTDTITALTGEIAFACDYTPTSNVGEYAITPSGVSAENYTITFVNGKVTVAQALLTVTAENKTVTYGDSIPTYTATYSGWKNTDDASVVSNLVFICEYAPTSNVGKYTITPDSATALNYTFAYVSDTLTVNQAALMITAENKTVTYGDSVPTYTATYSGWKNTDDASVVSGLVYTCAYAPTSNVGEYTITPNSATAQNYAISYTNGKLTVGKADLMITAEDKNVIYGDAAPTYTATYSGWKNDDDASVVDSLIFTCEYAVTSNIGEYAIVPSGAVAQNYQISYTNGKVTVSKAVLTITANDTVMTYGDAAPAFTASYSGWKNDDNASVVSGLTFSTPYQPGSPIGTYAIIPDSATAMNYAITFAEGKLTVNKAVVKVKGAQVHEAKFADGHAGAEVTDKGTLNGVKLNDPLNHVTTASFSSAEVSEHLTITLFYELTGDAALLNNYDLQPTSEIFTTEGVIIEPFIPDTARTPESEKEQTEVQEGISVYAYGYCKGDSVGLKYHLNSGNPDQYKIDFADSLLFKNVDWTDLDITGPDGLIYIDVPVNAPTGDYKMTVYFRDSRFPWLPSQALNVTFHVNLPETFVKPLFDNTIVLVDTCECFTDIQWYYRETSSDPWAPIPGATGHYYRPENGTKLTGEYFVSAKMNGVPTYTCGQEDMETLYGADKNQPQAQVSAYPNPVESNTTVTIQNSTNWNHNLRVVNLMGIEVLNTAFEGDETVVNMSGFVSGNYMISVDGITVKVMKK